MQATAAKAQASSEAPPDLARDLFALVAYLLRANAPDTFRALSELELSLTQVKLLHQLDIPDCELSLKQLAEQLSLSVPAASRAIDALHQRGYVARHENEHDRRMKRVSITPAGVDALRTLNEMRLSRLQEFAETMSPAERRRLAAALAPLVARPEIAALLADLPARR